MNPVSGASTSSSSSASAAAQRHVPSDKDEKLAVVPDPADEILAALEESAEIGKALAIAAGIMRRPAGDPAACKEAIAPLTTVALALIEKDGSLQLLQMFLGHIQKNNPEFQGIDLLALLFTGNNKLVEQLLLQVKMADVKKLPAEFQKALLLPQVGGSISELHLRECDPASLVAIFPHLQKLSINDGKKAQALSALTRLEELSIVGEPYFDSKLNFKEFKALTTFSCKHVARARDSKTLKPFPLFERLNECPKLHTLRLEGYGNGPYPVMPQVLNLALLGGAQSDGAWIKAAFPALQTLFLQDSQNAAKLETIPSLRSLTIERSDRSGNQTLKAVCRQQPQLTHLACNLHIEYHADQEKWERAFASFQSLQELTHLSIKLDLNITPSLQPEQLAKMVGSHPKLQAVTIQLDGNSVHASYAEILAPLKGIPRVQVEYPCHFSVKEEVKQQFARILPQCTFHSGAMPDDMVGVISMDETQQAFLQVGDPKDATRALATFVATHQDHLNSWMQNGWNAFKTFPPFMKEAFYAAGHATANRVTTLDLTGSLKRTRADALLEIANYFPYILGIKCILHYSSQEEVDALAVHFKSLRDIALYESPGSGHPFHKVTFAAWTQLTDLTAVTIHGVMTTESLGSLVQAKPELRALTLGTSMYCDGLLDIVARLERLETLDLNLWREGAATLEKLTGCFPHLRLLRLPYSQCELTAENLAVFEGKPELRELGAAFYCYDAIRALGAKCPSLVALEMYYKPLTVDQASALKCLPNLKKLTICVEDNESLIAIFEMLVAVCPQLEELYINCSSELRVADVKPLEKLAALKKFGKLELREPYHKDNEESHEVAKFYATLTARGCELVG